MKNNWFKHLIQVILLGGFFALIILVAVPTFRYTRQKSIELKNNLIKELEAQTGLLLEYDKISPSILRFVAIRNLRFKNPENLNTLLRVNRVKVFYSLGALIKQDWNNLLDEIRFENTALRIDTEEDSALSEMLESLRSSDPSDTQGSGGSWIPERLNISGKNISLFVQTEWGSYSLERIFFRLEQKEELFKSLLKGRLEVIQDKSAGPWHVKTQFKTRGNIGLDFDWFALDFNTIDLESSHFELENQKFYLQLLEQHLKITKIQDKLPLDIEASFGLDTGDWALSLITEEFSPRRLIQFTGPWAPIGQWDFPDSSLNVAVKGNLQTGELQYDFRGFGGFVSPGWDDVAQFNAGFSGDNRFVQVDNLFLNGKIGRFIYKGEYYIQETLPNGILHIQDFTLPGLNKKLYTSVQFNRIEPYRFDFLSDQLRIGTTQFLGLNISFDRKDGKLKVKGGAKISGQGKDGDVSFKLSSPYSFPQEMVASLELTDLSLGEVYKLMVSEDGFQYPVYSQLDRYEWYSTVFFEKRQEGFTLTSLKNEVHTKEDQLVASASLAATEKGFNLYGLELLIDDQLLQTEVEGFLQDGVYKVSGQLDWNDNPLLWRGELEPGKRIDISADYDTHFQLIRNPGKRTQLSFETTDFPFIWKEDRVLMTTKVDGLARDGDWKVLLNQLRLDFVSPRIPTTLSLDMGGQWSDRILNLDRVNFFDEKTKLEGMGRLQYLGPAFPYFTGDLQLEDQNKEEKYLLTSANDQEGNPLIFLKFDGLPLSRYLSERWMGSIKGNFSYNEQLGDASWKLTLDSRDLNYEEEPMQLNLDMEFLDQALNLKRLNVDYRDLKFKDGLGEINLTSQSGLIQVPFSAYLGPEQFSSNLTFTWNWFRDQLDTGPMQVVADLGINQIKMAGKSYPQWNIAFRPEEGSGIRFSGGPNNILKGTYAGLSNIKLSLAPPFPLNLTMKSSISQGVIDSTITDISVEIDRILQFLGMETSVISRGSLRGDLKIKGPVNDPDFFGALRANEVVFQAPVLQGDLALEKANLIFNQKSILLKETMVKSEEGNFFLVGEANIDHWIPSMYGLNINIPNPPGVPYTFKLDILELQGYLWGDFEIAGTFEETEYGGNLIINNSSLVFGGGQDTSEEPEDREEKVSHPMTMDLTLTIGSRVEFYAPSQAFPIIKGFLDSGSRISLYLDSLREEFSLYGTLGVQKGQINYLKSRSFFIKEGELTLKENQEVFSPHLYVRAETKEKDDDGNDFSIFLIQDGPLLDFKPRFEASPAKSEAEILAILGLPNLGESDTLLAQGALDSSGTYENYAMDVRDMIGDTGSLYLIRPLEITLQEALNLDLFTIRTEMLKNAVLYRDEIQTFQSYLDNTRLFFGKYLSDDIFFETTFSVRSYENRDAIFDASQTTEELQYDLEFGLDFDTPFFRLEWSLSPESQESLFVKDNTFSFSWRKSY